MTSLAQSRASENIVIDYNKPPVTLIRLLTSVRASFTHPENLNFAISYNIFTHIQQPNKLMIKRMCLRFIRVQLPQDWLGTPTWLPWRHVKMLKTKFLDPDWSSAVLPELCRNTYYAFMSKMCEARPKHWKFESKHQILCGSGNVLNSRSS